MPRMLDHLISIGMSINGNGESLPPLHTAVLNGDLETVLFLLERNAQININGLNALNIARENGHDYIADLLMYYGAIQ